MSLCKLKLHGYCITVFFLYHGQSPLLQISVYVHNIPSCSNPDLTLGSVAFAETFVDSLIHTEDGWDSQHVVLTTKIPNTLSWPVSHSLW